MTIRVLHIQKAAGVAGSERHLLELLPALAERGVEPRLCVLAVESARDFVTAMQERGIPVVSIPAGPDSNPLLVWRLAQEIRRYSPDLVHTHLIHADIHGQLAARITRVAGVSSIHGTHPFYEKEPTRSAARLAGHLARRTIAISRHAGDFACRVGIAPPSRVRVIHYGINGQEWPVSRREREAYREALGLRPEEVVIGIASRLVPGKGHDVALEAFASTVTQVPEARLLIAGSGPLRPELESRSAHLLPPGTARFLGFVADIRSFFGACDLVLFPSLPAFGEGFGLAALEAMASGVPVVSSDAGPLPEVVADRESGLVVGAGDVNGWAEAMTSLACDASLRISLGEQAIRRAGERFSVSRMVDQTLDVYAEALPNSRISSVERPAA